MIWLFEVFLSVAGLVSTSALLFWIVFRRSLDPLVRCILFLNCVGSFTVSTSYLAVIGMKIDLGYSFLFRQLVNAPSFKLALFCHETGFGLLCSCVFIFATERLLVSKRPNVVFSRSPSGFLLSLVVCLLAVFIAFIFAYFIHYQSDGIFVSGVNQILQVTGLALLFVALHRSRRAYVTQMGTRPLESRYQTAEMFYMSRSVLGASLFAVALRLAAFSCILAIVLKEPSPNVFAWLSFTYHNLTALSIVVFPWLIILRSRRLCAKPGEINDLSGNNIAKTHTAEEHIEALNRHWQGTRKTF